MSNQDKGGDFIIESVKEDGKPFRPSDWIERISSHLANYGPDHRLHYAEGAQPCIVNGEKCLCVKKALMEENLAAYQYILQFATDNQLRVLEDRRLRDTSVPTDRRSLNN